MESRGSLDRFYLSHEEETTLLDFQLLCQDRVLEQ